MPRPRTLDTVAALSRLKGAIATVLVLGAAIVAILGATSPQVQDAIRQLIAYLGGGARN